MPADCQRCGQRSETLSSMTGGQRMNQYRVQNTGAARSGPRRAGARAKSVRGSLHLLAVLSVIILAWAPAPASAHIPPPAALGRAAMKGKDVSPGQTAAQAGDFYYTFGQRTPVVVASDQVGILAGQNANVD